MKYKERKSILVHIASELYNEFFEIYLEEYNKSSANKKNTALIT